MTVKLTYFKASGKYYSEGEYKTKLTGLYSIFSETRELMRTGKPPGLADGVPEFYVLVDVPRHQHRHPYLITPDSYALKATMDQKFKWWLARQDLRIKKQK